MSSEETKKLELVEKRLKREIRARKSAEDLLEKKALELFFANKSLLKQNEEKSKEIDRQNRRFEALIQSAQEFIYETDISGNFTFVNNRILEFTGRKKKEVIGSNFLVYVREDYRDIVLEFYADTKKMMEEESYLEFPLNLDYVKEDTNETWVGQNVKAIITDSEITGFRAIARDISKLKVAEFALKKAEKSEKEFLAKMSHEIRTPLNAIIGISNLLKDTKDEQERIEFISAISSSAHILHGLISDILDISKIEAGQMEVESHPFDIKSLLFRTKSTFHNVFKEKNLSIDIDIDDSAGSWVEGDERLLNQVLVNLLGNSLKFTDNGGVEIHAHINHSSEEIDVWEFSVKDSGIGILGSELPFIFEKFKQANSGIRGDYGGTGLGLPICKELVELQGGMIWVISQFQEGTEIIFQIPFKRHDGKAKVNIGFKKLSPVKEFKGVKILLVEDNEFNVKYMTRLLDRWQCDVQVAFDGEMAIERCAKKKYDIIFMDLFMDGMNGLEATESIRTTEGINQDTVIVGLSASAFRSDREQALQKGMNDFLSKPITPSELKIRLAELIEEGMGTSESDYEEGFSFSDELDSTYLKSYYGEDLDFALEMFESFIDISSNDIMRLQDSVKIGDLQSLGSVSHKLKPSFQMVGLSKLAEQASRIDQMVKSEQSADEVLAAALVLSENILENMPIVENEVSRLKALLNED